MSGLIKKGIKTFINEGVLTVIYKVKNKYSMRSPYYKWIKENEKDIYKAEQLSYNPLISIIVPVYNVVDKQLISCIESVKKQTYKNWELCLVDDFSTWKSIRKVLSKYENKSKIKIKYRTDNGHIARATNDGIAMSTGEFIAFLDCDDLLMPNALYEMAKKLNENKSLDFIYSDEDKITENGRRRHTPFFKPDWSPDTIMSLMYTCHFSIYRSSLVKKIGGIQIGYEGAQDYDFVLRFTELTDQIAHIPKVLYHWRERKESTSLDMKAKPYVLEASRKAKEDALCRRGYEGNVVLVDEIMQYRVIYNNRLNPLVSIIIPSKDNYMIFQRCLQSIKKLTKYINYEILIVDNGSNEENRKAYTQLCKDYNCKYHYDKMEFNFSKMCNIGAKLANGSILLFLNDDIEVLQEDWIDIMVGHSSLPYVGAVGAKLYYPESKTIQHAGVLNLKVGPSHSLLGFEDSSSYYFNRNTIEYNYIAVTGACFMIEKHKFEQVKGFDESFPVAYNDVDLCFKLLSNGYYNVLRNDVTLYHYESASRGYDLEDVNKTKRLKNELNRLYKKHKNYNGYDPFYNPNLSENNIDYNLKNLNQHLLKYSKCKIVNNKMVISNSERLLHHIDLISNSKNHITIEGWAFYRFSIFSNLNKKSILLIDKKGKVLSFTTVPAYRPDVTTAFGKKFNLNFSGFVCNVNKKYLSKGKYKVFISYRRFYSLKNRMKDTGKILEI